MDEIRGSQLVAAGLSSLHQMELDIICEPPDE